MIPLSRRSLVSLAVVSLGASALLGGDTTVGFSFDYEGNPSPFLIQNNTAGVGFMNQGALPFGADPGGANAFQPLNAGSGVQIAFFKGNPVGVDTISFSNTTYDVPTDVKFAAANLTFDYAYQANTDSGGLAGNFTITVSGANGTLDAINLSPTVSGSASGTISANLLDLFRNHIGETLTLTVSSTQAAAGFPNRYLNFALDNVLLTYSIGSGGGSGASAPAVATRNANRRSQQQMQAHQARVARQQVAQQHRRNQQRR